MPKQRRAIRRQFIIVLAIVLIGIVSVFKIPSFLISRNLGDLGYDKEAQKAIINKKISKLLIDNDYYSKLLNDEVKKDTFKTDYAELYIFRDSLSDLEFTLYDKLLSKGYEDKEVIELFRNLENYELTPLLVFDKVEIKTYIDDCLTHRDTNSQDNLTLSNDYLHPYEDYQKITDVKADTFFIQHLDYFQHLEGITSQSRKFRHQYFIYMVALNIAYHVQKFRPFFVGFCSRYFFSKHSLNTPAI